MLVSLNPATPAVPALESALSDLRGIIAHRIAAHFNGLPVQLHQWLSGQYPGLVNESLAAQLPFTINNEEWIILIIALVPHISPDFFESIIREQLPAGGDFPEFGGVKGTNHRGLLPTGETVQFVLAGMETGQRLQVQRYFREEHPFFRQQILWLEPVKEGEPAMSGRIIVAEEFVDKILYQKQSQPRFGIDFPAKRITTGMYWADLVLSSYTASQVAHIQTWLQYNQQLLSDENLRRKLTPGFRVLFYGPPGTGKTLTATLLGKQFDKDVYRIDLSQVVSKYIGETEKNLERVFIKAEHKNWILFFDEADALFGKRTNVQSAHDKYANQEIAYLLQRVEDYAGLIILASNFKNNIDDAFLRRFNSIIHFPLPNEDERLLLWRKSMPASLPPAKDVDLRMLAEKYEITGADIVNVIHFAALKTLQAEEHFIRNQFILEGIRQEFRKQDKTMS